MFWHVFKNRLKITLRDREMLFWLFGFIFIMATLFNWAFAELNNSIQFEPVEVAVVQDANFKENIGLQEAIKTLSEGDSKLLDVQETDSHDKAMQKLTDKDVGAVISVVDEKPKVEVLKNGFSESLVKVAIDQSLQASHAVIETIQADPSLIQSDHLDNLGQTEYVEPESQDMDHTAIYFYALIGMSCIMAGSLGLLSVNQGEANLSQLGKRLSASPASKRTVLMANLGASYVVSLVAQLLLYAYLAHVLQINFGPDAWAILLAILLGPLAGLALGTLIGASNQWNDNIKNGILVGVTMTGAMLAGMMGSEILKHQIDRNLPWLNAINPVNTVSDALFSVYYFGVGERYWLNLIYILGFTVVAIFISWLFLRRKRYDSL